MAVIRAICISDQKGTQKYRIPEGTFTEDYGIEGDAHAGKWHRQVSLLSAEKIQEFRDKGVQVEYGAFGENLVVEAPCRHALRDRRGPPGDDTDR